MYETTKLLSCLVLDKNAQEVAKELDRFAFIDVVGAYDSLMEALSLLSQQQTAFMVIDSELLYENENHLIINKFFSHNRVVVIGKSDEDFVRTLTLGNYHYLEKPLHKPFLLDVIKKIYQLENAANSTSIEINPKASDRNGLFVKGDSGYVRIDFDDIDYIKAFGEYAKLYTGDKWVLLMCTLKKITEQLPTRTFARVHRSFTVRIGSIRSFDAYEIRIGDQYVPIGRNYKKHFESSLLTLA